MNDRMTTAHAALTKAAKTFREYQAHHQARADAAPDSVAAPHQEKADRNARLATECEGAAALLTAQ